MSIQRRTPNRDFAEGASLDVYDGLRINWICDLGCNLRFRDAFAAADHFGQVHPDEEYRPEAYKTRVPCPVSPEKCAWFGPPGHAKIHVHNNHRKLKKKRKSREA